MAGRPHPRPIEYTQERIRRRSVVKPDSGCWEWAGGRQANGYGRISFMKKSSYVHRVSYLVFKGEISSDLDVCHSCDNRICCNPDHLFLGTRLDNMRDCVSKGRHSHGEKHSQFVSGENSATAKLNWVQVREIRRLRDSFGRKTKDLAAMFGVTKDNVYKICAGITWKES